MKRGKAILRRGNLPGGGPIVLPERKNHRRQRCAAGDPQGRQSAALASLNAQHPADRAGRVFRGAGRAVMIVFVGGSLAMTCRCRRMLVVFVMFVSATGMLVDVAAVGGNGRQQCRLYVGGNFYPVLMGPGQPLGGRETAAVSPALRGRLAAAAMVLAGKRRRCIDRGNLRQRIPPHAAQIRSQRHGGDQPAEQAPSGVEKSAGVHRSIQW